MFCFRLPLYWSVILTSFLVTHPGVSASTEKPTLSTRATICPNESLGEKPQDCPWAKIARDLITKADAGRPVLPLLKALLPDLFKQIQKDSKIPIYRELWGKSINFDEFAKGVVVHPAIIAELSTLFGTPISGQIVHAGVEHTYGYLFSVLKTSFGYKRARWVEPTLEQGFALHPQTLSPTPLQGTLFSNITYFLGRIAFRNDPKELSLIRGAEVQTQLPKNLTQFDYKKLKITRLSETLSVSNPSGQAREVILRTDLVAFSRVPEGQKNSHLLIYSALDPALGGARLITGFPVEKSFVEIVLNPKNLGANQVVVSRYNAFIEDLSGKEGKGLREVTENENSAN